MNTPRVFRLNPVELPITLLVVCASVLFLLGCVVGWLIGKDEQ